MFVIQDSVYSFMFVIQDSVYSLMFVIQDSVYSLMFVIQDSVYSLMFGNNNWYLFLRLHHILYQRLSHFNAQSQLALEEESQSRHRSRR